MKSPYYLSIVAAARNDNYGGDFDVRFQNCITWFDYYANKYHLPCEFVIVNYNPLPDRPALKDMLRLPAKSVVTYRIINVPGSFHQQLLAQGKRLPLPFFEYVAKNIGVRRAQGEYILCINPDVLFDPAIIKQIAGQKLKPNYYYRADRADYNYEGSITRPESDLKTIRAEVFRIFTKGKTYDLKQKGIDLKKLLTLRWNNYFYLKWNLLLPEIERIANHFSIPVIYDNVVFKFHCNHGDFLMMHRKQWSSLRGHPETTYHPMHTDSLTIASAYSSGLKESVFLYPIYHADHGRRFISDNTVPDIKAMYELFMSNTQQMLAEKKPIIYNPASWGFENQTFSETTLQTQ